MRNFTVIDHEKRKSFGLNLTEYCVLDLLNNLPKARKTYIADQLGITRKTVSRIVKKFISKKILIYNDRKYKIPNWKTGQNVPKNFSQNGTKCPTERDKMSHQGGQNVPSDGTKCPTKWDKMSHYNNTSINTNINYNHHNHPKGGRAAEKERNPQKNIDKEAEKVFKKIWETYPKKIGESKAYKIFQKEYRKDKEIIQPLLQAVQKYKLYIKKFQIQERYIEYGSRFFLHWRDWQKYTITIDSTNAFEEQYQMRGKF